MNIRFVAVDNDGREIEDDNPDLHPPVHAVHVDTIPRTGDSVLFYNTDGRDLAWTVVGTTWMVAPDGNPGINGYAHACVMIRRGQEDD